MANLHCEIPGCNKQLTKGEIIKSAVRNCRVTCNQHDHLRYVYDLDAYLRIHGSFDVKTQK
jgi:hypothetical protein